jgi:protein SCO1/2
MKSNLALALCLVAAPLRAAATDATVAPCCVPAAPTKPACCSEEKMAADKPLSDRSLYQLDATWTNDAGKPVALASLRGRPVIMAMFFAQCEYACPVLVHDLKRIRAALPEGVREKVQLVLVTFDTERDTPAALKAFRERMSLDEQWTLLRGETMAVQDLAMLLGVKFKQDARGQFAHSNLLTVMNAGGEIVHRHAGLNGDISEAARAVVAAK